MISISDIDITGTGVLFIVMELVSGLSLGQLRHMFGPSHQRWGFHVLRQLAAALSALHAEGIVHRDLKPDNLLVVRPEVDELPLVKLADFGIAILLDDSPAKQASASDLNAATIDMTGSRLEAADTVPGHLGGTPRAQTGHVNAQGASSRDRQAYGELTHAGTIVGTPLYMAPELAAGSKHAQPPADIFSFGIMAFEILTGQLPFERPPILSRILGEEVKPSSAQLPHLGAPLAKTLARCLSMAPEQRPTAQEIVALLEAIDLAPGGTTAVSK